MMPRLTSAVLVNALVRRTNAAGGSAMVLAKGDEQAGAILIVTLDRGGNPRIFERGIGPDGNSALIPSGPETPSEADLSTYWQRRRSRDPDLWVVELDIADAQRLAAETMNIG